MLLTYCGIVIYCGSC